MGSKIRTVWDRIGVWATNTTSAWVFGFVAPTGGQVTTIFNYSFTSYQDTPLIKVSPQLTKLVILGQVDRNGTNVTKVDAYYINFK